MKAIGKILKILLLSPFIVVGLIVILAFIDGFFNTYHYRERITLSVQTPNGVVTASGVWSTTIKTSFIRLTPETSGATVEDQGEAIPLELAPGKWLFVLFGGTKASAIVSLQDFPEIGPRMRALRATLGDPPTKLDTKKLGLGTFLDIDTPNSFRFVEGDNLEPFFGPGYSIVSATVEITRDSVTEGRTIKVLDWWMDHRAGPFNAMTHLRMPDDSPRGWMSIYATSFWSHDQLKKLTKEWKAQNGKH